MSSFVDSLRSQSHSNERDYLDTYMFALYGYNFYYVAVLQNLTSSLSHISFVFMLREYSVSSEGCILCNSKYEDLSPHFHQLLFRFPVWSLPFL